MQLDFETTIRASIMAKILYNYTETELVTHFLPFVSIVSFQTHHTATSDASMTSQVIRIWTTARSRSPLTSWRLTSVRSSAVRAGRRTRGCTAARCVTAATVTASTASLTHCVSRCLYARTEWWVRWMLRRKTLKTMFGCRFCSSSNPQFEYYVWH